jgi:hypothetical protein
MTIDYRTALRTGLRGIMCAGLAGWLVAALPGTAFADPFDDAKAAYDRGDKAGVVKILRPLADQGNAIAEANLGIMYSNGEGVAKDPAEAAKWYRKAADQGNIQSQINLGALYAMGQGLPKDYVQAHKWFTLAIAGIPPGPIRERVMQNRDLAASQMTPAQIAESDKLARDWKPQ